MDNRFFKQPILNSSYAYPARRWELDNEGQPTQKTIKNRHSAEFITPIPKPRKRRNKDAPQPQEFVFDEGKGLSTQEQQYDPTPIINELRSYVYKWRDPDKDPELHLFGQLKRITRQWLDNCLVCKGGTHPAQLMCQELADMACERITAGITRSLIGERPVKAMLDLYNPTGSTMHANFNTSKKSRWQTDACRCHIKWVILDSDWEA